MNIGNSQTAAACLYGEADCRGNSPQPCNLLPEDKNNDGWSTLHSETQNNFTICYYMLNTFHFNMCQHHSVIICSHVVLPTECRSWASCNSGTNNRACLTRYTTKYLLFNVSNFTLSAKQSGVFRVSLKIKVYLMVFQILKGKVLQIYNQKITLIGRYL